MKQSTLLRVLKYLKKDIISLIITSILSIVTVLGTIYVPILFGDAIDQIIDVNDVNIEAIIKILFKVEIIVIVTAILQWVMMSINNKMTYRITRRLRSECFKKIQVLPLKYLDSHSSGETVSIIINDIDSFSEGLLLGFTQLLTGLATIIGTIVIMMLINWIIGLIVIVVTPLSLFVAKFIATKTYKLFKEQSEVRAKQTGFINEMIGNLKVVKAYSQEKNNMSKFNEINSKLQRCSLKATFYSSLTNPCTRFVNSIVYALVALFGAIFVISPVGSMTLTIGALTSFLSYANQYTKPFNEISSVITELQNSFACIRRVFNLLDEENELVKGDEIELETPLTGNVNIDNVYFSYTKEQKLIQNFNLNANKGQKIAIVGPTGCGKTTLINLLMRFYDVTNGTIKVDDIDIRNITRNSLRNNYGMVLQDTWIKTASVRDNIAFGKNDATIDEVIQAAKKANAHSFIKRLPNGYDTIIRDDGNLSIGEKQLLCIARIMLCSPTILILDEATSSIDTRTEIKIQEAFDTIMEGKTTFIVAHRISTIQEADVILVMNEGNIIEQGNHYDLLEKNGFYAKLYNSQFVKE